MLLNEYRERKGLPEITVPPEIIKTSVRFYKFLKDYIDFFHDDGMPCEGSGKPFTELIEPTQPAVPFSDVGNDPYFVVKQKMPPPWSMSWKTKIKI